MDQSYFDILTRSLSRFRSRRTVLGGLAGAGLGWGMARLPGPAAANKSRKRRQGLCQKNGSRCRKPGKQCKKQYCLRAPFTIEARGTQIGDHDTVLFVPPENATTGPFPFIDILCTTDSSRCEEQVYPFACVDGNDEGSDDETTTIRRLLPGKYEYWLRIGGATPAGAETVVLKDSAGRIVRQWANPAAVSAMDRGWHVFDIDGNDGRVISVDTLIRDVQPSSNSVCPN